MNQNTINSLYTTTRNVTVKSHADSGVSVELNLLWQLLEPDELPPKDKVSIYNYIEVHTDNEVTFGSPRLYRARGAVVQELMLPKYDNSFHDGVVLASALQNEWRRQRERAISYYDPMIFPEGDQPKQSFLQWKVRVVYDVFETVN